LSSDWRENEVNILRMIINGVTDEIIWKRIGWMYASFFLLFVPITAFSFLLLPEGILIGKHPIISRLEFSPNLWISTLQIFGYNLIPTLLIIGANLIAQQSRISPERYVPVGYLVFCVQTAIFAIYLGTWSFGVVTVAPPLYRRLLRIFDIVHHAGLLEFSAYLLAATVSFKFTLWYSDRKRIVANRSWRDVIIARSEKVFLALAIVLLLCGAFIESYGIIQLAD
jgi:uncharacterized membrane protein SpoIIM required for sporulation